MRRGDIFVVSAPGEHGKPRPALLIQSDFFSANATLTFLLISSTLIRTPEFRIAVQPSPDNGLREPSEIMVDKATTLTRNRIGQRIGTLDNETMTLVNRSMAVFLGLA
jgi:mRNA interferase MazF